MKVSFQWGVFQDIVMRGKLVAVIGDENTCTGFLLAGVGETRAAKSNFFVVDQETPKSAIEDCFVKFMEDENVAVIVINQVGFVASTFSLNQSFDTAN